MSTTSSYYDVFREIVKEREDIVNNDIAFLKREGFPECNDGSIYADLSTDFEVIGVGNTIYNKDYITAKQKFFLSAKLYEYILLLIDKNDNRIAPYWASMNFYKILHAALISDNLMLAQSLASRMGNRPEIEKDDYLVNNVLGYILKYLVLNQTDNAIKHMSSISEKKLSKIKSGYELAAFNTYKAFLSNDRKLIAESFSDLLKKHRTNRDFKESQNEFISIEGIGILKLLRDKGIIIDIIDDLIPSGLFEKHEIQYPEIDYFVL